MKIDQDIQSYKMRYSFDYIYWIYLFKSIKINSHRKKSVTWKINTNEADSINSHPKNNIMQGQTYKKYYFKKIFPNLKK